MVNDGPTSLAEPIYAAAVRDPIIGIPGDTFDIVRRGAASRGAIDLEPAGLMSLNCLIL